MPTTVAELDVFLSLSPGDEWTVKPTMYGLDGKAIRIEFRYYRRAPLSSTVVDTGGDNYVEVWWHKSKQRYSLLGPHINQQHYTDEQTAVTATLKALGQTGALIERDRIAATISDIDGIGPATITRLHRKYGDIETILDADPHTLEKIPLITPSIAEEIESKQYSRCQRAENDEHQIQLASWGE